MNNKKFLNIVLYEPEIALNVGAIMRTCVALNAKLHLIEPFGFIFDNRFLQRSSVNYIQFVDYQLYNDWEDFNIKNKNIKLFCATRYSKNIYSNVQFNKLSEIYIMFGRESTGIPKEILQKKLEYCFRIPMHENVRSLNLANSVGIVGYEVMRQCNFPNLSTIEIQKGEDFLEHK